MVRRIKRIIEFLFLGLCVWLLLNEQLVVYGFRQAAGQLRITFGASPVEEFMEDPAFPDSLKLKLKLVAQIKRFAFDSLGIKYSKNYSTLFDQGNKPVMFVVTACKPYSFEPYEWHFPVLGKVPYKGFFTKPKALVEYYKIKGLGYDTHLGTVSGWSTLGWFTDPILSNMLNNSDGDLAELIIHELTHGTLYVKNNATFNENLASFIGYKGALRFLTVRYGANSKELKEYVGGKKDEKKITSFMLWSAQTLDSLYKTFTPSMHVQDKENLKTWGLKKIIATADTISVEDKKRFLRYVKKCRNSKNAFFMQYVRYESKQDDFEKEFATFNYDLRAYLIYLKQKYPSL
jgi:predicted aminopeptidase